MIKEKLEKAYNDVKDSIHYADPETVLCCALLAGYYVATNAYIAGTLRTAKRATGLMYLAREDGIMKFNEDKFNGWALRQDPKRIKKFWKDQKNLIRMHK